MQFCIAVLLTCHNRRDTTLAALRALSMQELPPSTSLTVFLVDDGSTDGTGEAVQGEFPQVRLLRGDGRLFWGGGMRLAFAAAMAESFHYYLWLNDDTHLQTNAIARLLATHAALSARDEVCSIVVGATHDAATGRTTYGGVARVNRWHPLKFRLLEPESEAVPCATINGNIVLIPAAAARRIGNVSASFTHSMGDFDYGLRARKLGCSLWLAPGHLGSCGRNAVQNTWRDRSLPVGIWLRKVVSLKGLPPGEYRRFARAHGGPLWAGFWLLPYVRVTAGMIWFQVAGRFFGRQSTREHLFRSAQEKP